MCEWKIACVLVVFCFSLNCELFFEMWSTFKKWKWGMGFCLLVWTFKCYTIFCEWCNMTKHFTSKLKMYNCLITVFQKVMLLTKMFLQLQMRAPRYSQNFLLSIKVMFIVKVIFSGLTMMVSTALWSFSLSFSLSPEWQYKKKNNAKSLRYLFISQK